MSNPAQSGATPTIDRIDLKTLSREDLERFAVEQVGATRTRGREIYQWMWQRGARSFEEMSSLGRAARAAFAARARIGWLETEQQLHSADGTIKFLWRLRDGSIIESVLIPDGRRLTLCVSSQVGCAMRCSFCLTGDMGLARNLDPGEIAGQVLQVQGTLPKGRRITNLVLMGMGEPLHNLDNVIAGLRLCLDEFALNFSHRRVTVSTVGLVPELQRLASTLPVNLAVSLNATTDGLRSTMMPINRRYDLAELLDCCKHLPLPSGKRITFGYVLFAGINDTMQDAERLHELLDGVPAKLNLIPYNENPNRDLRRPDDEKIKRFQHYFVSRGLSTHVRTTRGLDIQAACGQLGKAPTQG